MVVLKTDLQFPEHGSKSELVLRDLENLLANDPTSEKQLATMYTQSTLAPAVLDAFLKGIRRNAGDPLAFPGSCDVEDKVVRMMATLFGRASAAGAVVTGGTEANILGLRIARNLGGKTKPEVVLPISAHYSYEIAVELLGITPVYVGLDEDYKVKTSEMEQAINSNTACLACSVGTTELGVIDPVEEISTIAEKHNLFLQVDASFGGFTLPFMKDLGYQTPRFDLSLPGVDALTVDIHKGGLAPIPAGCVLLREQSYLNSVPLDKVHHLSITSTRSAAPVFAAYVLFNTIGREGYRKIASKCMSLTAMLAKGIGEIEGIELVVKPETNMIGIKSESKDISKIAKRLREEGWGFKLYSLRPTGIKYIRIVILEHMEENYVNKFLNSLEAASRAV